MYKLIEEPMAKLKSHDWRVQQQDFFKNHLVKEVEFVQDQRVFDFFSKQDIILGIGHVDYFKKKLNIINNKKKCNHCLVVINEKTLDLDLIKILESIKNPSSNDEIMSNSLDSLKSKVAGLIAPGGLPSNLKYEKDDNVNPVCRVTYPALQKDKVIEDLLACS